MMKTSNKSWMIWAIVILALMNLATISTVVYHRNKTSGRSVISARSVEATENSSVKFSGRYFRDELGLTREQMNRFSEFNPVFRQEARRISLKLAERRQEMLAEMSSEDSDTNRLNELSGAIGSLHADLKKATYRYYMDFREICTPEQEEKLKQLFGEMFDNDIPAGPMGRGRMGRGRMMGPEN